MELYLLWGVVAVIMVMSIVWHEVAHGYMAYLLGDDTAYLQGRLSLNPVRHIDPFMTIMLPAFLLIMTKGAFVFGGAKPVMINPYRFRNPQRGMMWTGMAGPLANIVIALLLAAMFHFLHLVNGLLSANTGPTLADGILIRCILLNLFLAGFNLIPVPPLDGSRVLAGIVSYFDREKAAWISSLDRYGFMPIIILFIADSYLHILDYVGYVCRIVTVLLLGG